MRPRWRRPQTRLFTCRRLSVASGPSNKIRGKIKSPRSPSTLTSDLKASFNFFFRSVRHLLLFSRLFFFFDGHFNYLFHPTRARSRHRRHLRRRLALLPSWCTAATAPVAVVAPVSHARTDAARFGAKRRPKPALLVAAILRRARGEAQTSARVIDLTRRQSNEKGTENSGASFGLPLVSDPQ